MTIHLSSFYSHSISFLKEKVLPFTDVQKRIIAIVSFALACLAACYALLHDYLCGKYSVSNKAVQKREIDILPGTGKGEIATGAPTEVPTKAPLVEASHEVRDESCVVNQGTFQTIIRAGGMREVGQFENGQLHGQGARFDARGNLICEGEFRKGKLNGQGQFIQGFIMYDGLFQEDWLKRGRLIVKGIVIRDGEFEGYGLHGHGSEFSETGELMRQGEFQWGQLHGEGRYIDRDKTVYKGQFHKGDLKRGTATTVDGIVRYGEFQNGELHGKGQVFSNGKLRIQGEFLEGFLHGQCKLFRMNGELSMKGEFQRGFLHGKGTWIGEDGTIYSGQFQYNKLHGKGRVFRNRKSWKDGQFECGELVKGKSCDDGTIYEGQFQGKGQVQIQITPSTLN